MPSVSMLCGKMGLFCWLESARKTWDARKKRKEKKSIVDCGLWVYVTFTVKYYIELSTI